VMLTLAEAAELHPRRGPLLRRSCAASERLAALHARSV